ncbi:hypothetical protein [Paenibacillus medicaginis]|uniref:Uncharacterized protein n=1 Tax=Paenibacillus medicaginis TaxID=1470560 RepID=A0ABV5BUJ0_9BACL
MYLVKYPVEYEGHKYMVSVYEEDIFHGVLRIVAEVFVKNQGLLNFKRFKSVHKLERGWDESYKELAIRAVKSYAKKTTTEIHKELDKQKGIEEFKYWDGVIE